MTIFISSPKQRALRLLSDEGKTLAKFHKMGAEHGIFETDSEEVVERLREHKLNGTAFNEWTGEGKPTFKNNGNIGQGAITSGGNKAQFSKYKELGKLEAKLLKTDGSYRADATNEDIEKFENLKKELGE